MVRFLINSINQNNINDIIKQIKNEETIIITSSNNVIEYKKSFSNFNNVIVYDLKTFIYQFYQNHINKYSILKKDEQKLFFIKAINNSNNLSCLDKYSIDIIDDLIDIYQKETNYRLKKADYTNEIIADIENIFVQYKKMINNEYIDEQMLYQKVSDYLISCKEYKNINVVVSDCYYFNNIEREIIKNLVTNSKDAYLYFLTEEEVPGLEINLESFNYFKEAFKNNYIIENKTDFSKTEKNFIINNLYKLNSEIYESSNYFSVYGASDLYDEVIFVANQISNLVRTNEYRYRDFAIIGNNITDYENYFELIFNSNDIPYHRKKNINYAFFEYILDLLNIIDGNFKLRALINILKIGFYDISDYQINKVINLIANNADISVLDESLNGYINEYIIKPLTINSKNINTTELLTFLYNYLESLKVPVMMNKKDKETWLEFIRILNSIFSVYKDDSLSISELSEIFNYFFSKINVKNYYLDEVLVGDANIINGLKPKVTFFIGVNEGIVPMKISENILINNSNLNKYYNNYPKFNSILIDKFNTFYALLCSSDQMFVTYHKVSKSGSKMNPAPIINKLKSMYKIITVYSKENMSKVGVLKNLTYEHYLTSSNVRLKKYLKEYFLEEKTYKKYNKLIEYIPQFYNVDKINLDYLDSISISPSSMDMYNHCPFQYFCKYILKLNKTEIPKYDNRIVGTYIHYLLEKLISNKATKDNIDGLLKFWKVEFLKENKFKTTSITDYMFDKLNDSLKVLWPLVYNSIDNNKFIPHKLELNISNDELFKPIVLNSNNKSIYLRGIIDRVDLYNNHFRVIDYKTGSKKVDLNDIANGLNLQLFMYLLFISRSKPELIPVGLFYMPSLIKFEEGGIDPNNYRLTGMFLNNKLVIDGLGGDNINYYVDAYTRNKFKNDVLLEQNDLSDLLLFTEKSIIKTANSILDGNIKIEPIKEKKLCQYCDYQSICGIEDDSKNYRKLKKYDKQEIFSMIRGETDEMD